MVDNSLSVVDHYPKRKDWVILIAPIRANHMSFPNSELAFYSLIVVQSLHIFAQKLVQVRPETGPGKKKKEKGS